MRRRLSICQTYAKQWRNIARFFSVKTKRSLFPINASSYQCSFSASCPLRSFFDPVMRPNVPALRATFGSLNCGLLNAAPPSAIRSALGQAQSDEVIYRCFHCHATAMQRGPDLSGIRPGVECERCHGPGAAHLERPTAQTIRNPGRLPLGQSSQAAENSIVRGRPFARNSRSPLR
jgi:hypothetical protein